MLLLCFSKAPCWRYFISSNSSSRNTLESDILATSLSTSDKYLWRSLILSFAEEGITPPAFESLFISRTLGGGITNSIGGVVNLSIFLSSLSLSELAAETGLSLLLFITLWKAPFQVNQQKSNRWCEKKDYISSPVSSSILNSFTRWLAHWLSWSINHLTLAKKAI